MSRKQRCWAFVIWCVVLGLIYCAEEAWKYFSKRQVTDAVAHLKAKGGRLHREWPENVDIVEAVFLGPQFTDEDLKLLEHFPKLRVAAFLKTSITDEAIQAFRHNRPEIKVVIN